MPSIPLNDRENLSSMIASSLCIESIDAFVKLQQVQVPLYNLENLSSINASSLSCSSIIP